MATGHGGGGSMRGRVDRTMQGRGRKGPCSLPRMVGRGRVEDAVEDVGVVVDEPPGLGVNT